MKLRSHVRYGYIPLKQYTERCDQHSMENYLKQVSQNIGAILKTQHGDQYGFGDDFDNDLYIMKYMDQKMLDDPDAANTKSIESYLKVFESVMRIR